MTEKLFDSLKPLKSFLEDRNMLDFKSSRVNKVYSDMLSSVVFTVIKKIIL